jgi:hypothetical protein
MSESVFCECFHVRSMEWMIIPPDASPTTKANAETQPPENPSTPRVSVLTSNAVTRLAKLGTGVSLYLYFVMYAGLALGSTFSQVSSILALHSKYTRTLTFENIICKQVSCH